MEKSLIQKMEDQFIYFGGMSLLYGGVFAFCLYGNVMGATAIICVMVTILFAILFLRKLELVIKKSTKQYFIGMLLLGLANCITANEFFILFNWVGVLLLLAVSMIHQFYGDESWSFPAYMLRLLLVFGTTVISAADPFKHGKAYLSTQKGEKRKTAVAILAGLGIALVFLIIVLPLLLQSDIIFKTYFENIFRKIKFNTLIGIGCMVILGALLSYSFFSALCRQNVPDGAMRQRKMVSPIMGITFTSVLAIIYVCYCSIQILNLFMGIQKGLPAGITYSQYAHSGFWQLLAVSIINFITVLICMLLFQEHKVLKGLLTVLSVCTFIMIASAAYRMRLYVKEYRLTFLRIMVLWFLMVLILIMCGTVISIFRRNFRLFQYIVTVVACCYIILSFSRPDYLAAKYNISHAQQIHVSDVRYLLSLSLDAAPVLAEIEIDDVIEDNEYADSKEGLRQGVDQYFKSISEKNEDIYFRKANYSKISAKWAADKYILDLHF